MAGSVDDGKSTLLGRLLNDTEKVFADEVEAVRRASGTPDVNLAFFTDGLITERAKGITLDVAWRHCELGGRRLLIADVPGHAELVRNMATGASVADAAVLLVDAMRGIQTQTRRHLVMLSGLGVSRVIVCLNKMDGVGFARSVADQLINELRTFGSALALELEFIPLSALLGDNVVHRSLKLDWYTGPTLAERLATLEPVPEAPGTFAVVQLGTDAAGWTSLHVLRGELRAGDLGVLEVSPLGVGRVRLDVPRARGEALSSVAVRTGTSWPVTVTWLGPGASSTGAKLKLLQHGRITEATMPSRLRRRSLSTGHFEAADSLSAGDVAEVELQLERETWLEGPALLVDEHGRTVGSTLPLSL
ncbi:MAG: GTP-binding protein [Archangium sp.]